MLFLYEFICLEAHKEPLRENMG